MSNGLSPAKLMSRRSEALRFLILFTVMAIPLLTLPWFVPMQPSRSISYLQGFSNPAFWVLLVTAFIFPAYWMFQKGGMFTRPLTTAIQKLPDAESTKRLTEWGLAACLVFGGFLLVVSFDLSGMGDAEYFLIRAEMVRDGKLPYVDFEYAYGPFLLYAPLALQFLGLGPSFSHAVSILLQAAAGYGAVYIILQWLMSGSSGRWGFGCILLATAPAFLLAAGSYTMLRFAGAALVACWLLRRTNAAGSLVAASLTGPLFLIGWMLSPEVAIAAALPYAALCAWRSNYRIAATLVSAFSVLGAVVSTPLLTQSYLTLLEFGGGGNNFPAYPSIHILFSLLAIFFATAHVASVSIRHAPVDWYIFLFSVMLIPGAFGRCDPLHVVFYGWGFIALATKYWMNNWTVMRRFSLAYVWIFLLTWTSLFVQLVLGNDGLKVVVSRTVLAGSTALEPLVGPVFSSVYLQKLREEVSPSLIVGEISSEMMMLPPWSNIPGSHRFATYFVGLENATSKVAFDRVARELSGKRVVLRSELLSASCPAFPGYPSVLFIFPTSLFGERNHKDSVVEPLCEQIRSAIFLRRHGSLSEVLFANRSSRPH